MVFKREKKCIKRMKLKILIKYKEKILGEHSSYILLDELCVLSNLERKK